jgi:hypothetical protein
MADLTEHERKVLRAFAESAVDDLTQGAALNAAAEFLRESGYLTVNGTLTERGKAALPELFPNG